MEKERKSIFEAIGMTYDSRAYKRIAEPLLNSGLIEMTLPTNQPAAANHMSAVSPPQAPGDLLPKSHNLPKVLPEKDSYSFDIIANKC
ncbi:MAG: hypothetical protein WDA26_08235 [Pusillimonas sp.]